MEFANAKTSPIVKVKNPTKAFGNFRVVNDISFEVFSGEIFGFLGANGAGENYIYENFMWANSA